MNIFDSWLVNTYIAHRGLHDEEAPENSIAAFKKAMDKFYAIELDVHLLADGTVAVFHDDALARMTGKDGFIKLLKKEDLKNYKLLGTKECIPTFEEVLKLVNGSVPILVEIKNTDKVGDLEKATVKLLKNYKGEYAVHSFNPYTVGWLKDNAPEIIRGQLGGYLKKDKLSFWKKIILKRMTLNRHTQPHFISYEAGCLPNKFVKKYKQLPVLAWTVRSQQEYMHVVKFCDNIIFEKFEPKI